MNDKDEFQDPRVVEALNKVLDSTAFAASKQSQALLKYLVARSQQEDDGSLKERMIGVNVFARSHDYNTGDDPIVRARVGELRKKLARYYQSELADPHSMLVLYQSILRLRRDLPQLGDGELHWRPSPDGVLVFDRGHGLVCTVNLTGRAVTVDRPGDLLLASVDGVRTDCGTDPATAILPADSAAWWT